MQPFPGPAGIAWKTGTSWGGRDAWALGVDARHAVGVWVRRPDWTPIPGATGARLALPLLLRASAGAGGGTDGLRLVFPPSGAALPEAGRVVLRAAGGRRPLTFLVDGAPLPTDPARREAAWLPPGSGFYRITVLDAEGAAARSEFRVRR